MPAPVRYEAVHEQMLRLATLAKRRGLGFDEWWREALRPRACSRCDRETLLPKCPDCKRRTVGDAPVLASDPLKPPGAVVWPTDTGERRDAQIAADGVREAWRLAWHKGTRPRGHTALLYLAALGREEAAAVDARGNEVGFAVA